MENLDNITNVTNERNNRITSSYNEGKSYGDYGLSLLLDKEMLSKSSVSCKLYGDIEILQSKLDSLISYKKYKDEDNLLDNLFDVSFEMWLNEALFAFGAFIWTKGDISYAFTDEHLSYLDKYISLFKLRVGDISDFVRCYHPVAILFNEVRVAVRKVESRLVEWWESSEIIRDLRKDLKQSGDKQFIISSQVAFFNRLSSYFYWKELDFVYSKISKKDIYIWRSSMPCLSSIEKTEK